MGVALYTTGIGIAQGQQRAEPAREPLPAGTHSAAAAGLLRGVGEPPIDLVALRSQLRLFQEYLNSNLQATFVDPYALLQDVKGTYLPRFGVVFHMELNLHPMRTLTMFGLQPYTEEELQQVRESKLRRIVQLKQSLSDLLLERGTELTAVPSEQSVAVVVHMFNLPSERTEGFPTQLVIEVRRGDLTAAKTQRMTQEEFRKLVATLEF
jgi:hypothetical protein